MNSSKTHIDSWLVLDNEVMSVIDGIPNSVDAREIFVSIKGNNNVSPSEKLPQVEFTLYNVDLRLVVESFTKNGVPITIVTGELVHYNKAVGELDSFPGTDHCLIDDVWFPISRSTYTSIKEAIDQIEIDFGSISLKKYLLLRKLDQTDFEIVYRQRPEQETIDPNSLGHPVIEGFNAKLYNYQILGYNWLRNICNEGFGCILGDEMGLGKTIQVIAVLLDEKNKGAGSSLIICPSSLLENWKREIFKFAPSVSTYIHSGSGRTGFQEVLLEFNVVITSYDVMIRDVELLNRIDWNLIVCDEAQAIKNHESQRSIAIRKINSNSRIAVSGTPFENRLTDIWSLFDFILPEFLGGLDHFNINYPNSIEGAQKLEPIISPLILRRLVKGVADDLPERIDIPEVISMDDFLEDLYDQKRNEIIAEYGAHASLVQIQSLRMLCCDPSLVLKDGINYSTRNPKLQRLIELVTEIFTNGEKVLVFTSYTAMADLILSLLSDQFGCYVRTIDGRTPIPERQQIIDEFSETTGKAALVLNPRAAGAGLNITAANHVIHYNLEWNPAIEDQASARAHRRGQILPVFIRRLYYARSVEEFVNSKIEEKRALSNAAVEGIEGLTEDFMNIYDALQYTPKTENI